MKNKIYMVFVILFLAYIMVYPIYSYAKAEAQIIEVEEIEELLAGEGVTISNIKITGDSQQIARFSGADYIEGFGNLDEGIILSTGIASSIFTPAKTFLSEAFHSKGGINRGSDKDLDKISKPANSTYDAVSIEFEAVSDSDFISFQYLFASEEFDQATYFNDIFALYVNGENIAKIPDSDATVAMESLRTDYPQYYYHNEGGQDLGFLGYSSLLSCQANVKAGETNKFKLVIADLSDPIYDSAVLIKAHSISNKEDQESEENPDPDPGKDETAKQPQVNVKKEVSKVKLMTADGKAINYIELEDGKNINELKSSFILDDNIFIISDNEMIQDAKIEIEYKITIKNTSYMSCTELLIEDYLDNGVVCKSEDWEYDDKDEKMIKKYLKGSLSEPIIKAKGEYETTLVVTRILSPSSEKYEFKNSARAHVINRGVKITSDTVQAQDVNIIPPFGQSKNSSIALFIIIATGTICVIFWKLKNKEK